MARIAMLIHRKICVIVKQTTQILLHFLHSFRIVQKMEKSENYATTDCFRSLNGKKGTQEKFFAYNKQETML